MQSLLQSELNRTARRRNRQRRKLIVGLRSIARRANTEGRARRYEVLLCDRARAVRPQLLEVAAALERASHPGSDTVTILRRLLTDGCTSPLFNPDIPAAQLPIALDRVQAQLDARELSDLSLSVRAEEM